jgi:predicted dithiol-disulfide oxidoreductase (DUF899 family)
MNDVSGKTNDYGSRRITQHAVGTRDEWRDARLRLLAVEKEHTRRSDELARRRQELPWVRVDKDYRFQSEHGVVSLADLFGGRSQLLVHHFMFTPSHGADGCPSCSAIADGYDGFRVHLENHDVALAAVSRTSIDVIAAYKKRMGWSFPWVSSANSDFNFDFGVSFRENQLVAGRSEHNFRPYQVDAAELPHGGTTDDPYDPGESPGVSAFVLDDGVVFHTYSAYERGIDTLFGMYQWLDRAPRGRNEQRRQPWFRRHDEYGDKQD